MKTRDLMRGDKVYETCLEDTPQVVTVEEVGQNHIYIGMEDDDLALLRYEPEHLGWDIKDIEPIPLTEEILKANGFIDENATNGLSFRLYVLQTNQEYGDVWGRTNHTITVAWREYNSDVYVTRPYGTSTQQKISVADIRYVHELQHALHICGLNELADNINIK